MWPKCKKANSRILEVDFRQWTSCFGTLPARANLQLQSSTSVWGHRNRNWLAGFCSLSNFAYTIFLNQSLGWDIWFSQNQSSPNRLRWIMDPNNKCINNSKDWLLKFISKKYWNEKKINREWKSVLMISRLVCLINRPCRHNSHFRGCVLFPSSQGLLSLTQIASQMQRAIVDDFDNGQ